MKINFKNAEKLYTGIDLIKDDLDIELVHSLSDLTVEVKETDERSVTVTRMGNTASISFGDGFSRFARALAILVYRVRRGDGDFTLTESPVFEKNGSMVDMSRNSVMKVDTVKFWLRKMALMGMNTFMLYTEDTYEIEERPYFGHMRGRYSKAELKELDSYARSLGIELVPCIQMLGHLETHLKWPAAGKYKDTDRVILVESDETYKLIDDMLRTVKECFCGKRIHIGMDETHDLGRGRYLDKNGYKLHRELYLEHLCRVVEMVRSYGLQPMMWSDMFFKMASIRGNECPDYEGGCEMLGEIAKLVPNGVQQVFWDYYHPNEDFYAKNIERHALLGDNTVFAGGVWAWGGPSIQFSRSKRNTVPALRASKNGGIKQILATVWHNGAEACQILALAGLAWYADFDYKGEFDEESVKECFAFSVGENYDDFMKTELPEYPDGGDIGISRVLLYNDPLIGLMDKQVEKHDTGAYYEAVSAELDGCGGGFFSEAFDVSRALAELLKYKANYGVRLKRAYDGGDKNALALLLSECDTIIEKLSELKAAHRRAWMKYSKPFGWEVHDIRYGGLLARFDTVKHTLRAFLEGEISSIDELEEKRLRYDARGEDDPKSTNFLWYKYHAFATPGTL